MKHIGAMALGILMLSACQDNDWDDHYGIDNSNTATMSVMQTLEANTDYSEFCKVIKEQHLDTLLNSDQSLRSGLLPTMPWQPLSLMVMTWSISCKTISTDMCMVYRISLIPPKYVSRC